MYGLINKAIRTLVTDQHGVDTWERVARGAGCADVDFEDMTSYPDELTYALVRSASETLGVPAADVLYAFGTHWTDFAADAGYVDLLDMTGDTFEELIAQLDDLHARIAVIFPALVPPSFDFEELSDEHALLHYYSERPGLAPMVRGLLEGLASRFGLEVDVVQRDRHPSDDHDVFELRGYAA